MPRPGDRRLFPGRPIGHSLRLGECRLHLFTGARVAKPAPQAQHELAERRWTPSYLRRSRLP